MYDILELNTKLLMELRDIAKSMGIKRVEILKKQDLVFKILDQQAIKAIPNIPLPYKKIQEPEKIVRDEPVIPVVEPALPFVPDKPAVTVAETVTATD